MRQARVDLDDPWLRDLVLAGFQRRFGQWGIGTADAEALYHWGEYERIDWEAVYVGEAACLHGNMHYGVADLPEAVPVCRQADSQQLLHTQGAHTQGPVLPQHQEVGGQAPWRLPGTQPAGDLASAAG